MFNDLFEELNRAFGDVTKEAKEASKNVKNFILVNAIENDDAYLVEAALPGVKKENVMINYSEGALNIEVKNEEPKEDTTNKYLVRERTNNYYKRTIDLQGVNSEGIRAKYENGILSIVLPKEKVETRTINID